jgi:cytochrome c oxidase cbb3-type subunit 2
MAFREYKIGARLFGVALGGSMVITLYLPTVDMTSVAVTETGLKKQLSYGRIGGFSYEDPFLKGAGKPKTVVLNTDPMSGAPIEPVEAYVYEPGIPFPSGINHPRTLGPGITQLSVDKGRITEADHAAGAVFVVSRGTSNGETVNYIENATATRGWQSGDVLRAAGDANTHYIGSGKIMFVKEGCWWCHTLLPEQTQDWQYFGVPPRLGDFNGESPTAFGSDRKAPDLLHVGSRNSSKEWMMMHFFNPRLVQPHSIMPRYDYLWGEADASGKSIDYAAWRAAYNEYRDGKSVYPPEVPSYAPESQIRYLLDFVLSLK